jgi:hypothetical protein
MHTVELLEEAIDLAKRSGFVVREDWFGGAPAGACQFKGAQWLFLDLALSPREKLDEVMAALRSVPIPADVVASPQLRAMFAPRKAA